MIKYLLRRLAASIVVLIGVSVLIFLIARVIPGDPARIALGPMASEEQVAQLRAALFLDRPLIAQYVEFARNLLRGDLGVSLYTNRTVTTDLRQFLPATAELVAAASLLMVVIGIPLGVLAGHFRDRWPDHAARLAALLGIVAPSFVWAIILVLVFSYWLDLTPVIGRLSDSIVRPPVTTGFVTVDSLIAGDWAAFKDASWHLVLPAVALSLSGAGQAARLTRANLGETYGRDYIDLARAYGFAGRTIAWKYALRPAMIPTLTILGLDFAAKLGNAFLVEAVFAWPGMARYGVNAILNKDLNAIVGTVLVIGFGFVVINLVIDLFVAYLDPRIRYRAAV
ncbi:MAG: ABC transporter permease [Proteobacteria bacterium]|nr:ABC transporter permease [Pseudomonadota bacterium]